RGRPPSASRAISRGRSMMWSSAGEAAAVIVSTIPLPGPPAPGIRTLLLCSAARHACNERGARARCRARARVRRQPPAPARAGASSRARGSSPVSALNAAGICRRLGTPSFWRSTSQCAFAVLGEMPRRSPTSSFEHPRAISTTIWSWRSVRSGFASSLPLMTRHATAAPAQRLSADGGIRPGGVRSTHEARLVAACIGVFELLLRQRADSEQQVELVAEVRPHHLRPVRGDREEDAVLDERAEDVPHRVLVGQRLREEVRSGADLEYDLALAQLLHQLVVAGREDSVPDPVRTQELEHLADLGAAHLASLLADVDRHAEARGPGGLHH